MSKSPVNDNNDDSQSNDAHRTALEFLFSRIDYERSLNVPYQTRQFRLERMLRLLSLLGNPQWDMRIVHLAGTKGKGSTAALLSGILTAGGYRTGLYTSPHLHCVEERIAIDSRPCTLDEFVELLEHIRPIVDRMDSEAGALNARKDYPETTSHVSHGRETSHGPRVLASAQKGNDDEYGPTFFEIILAMAFLHFARQRVDMAILEVGMGGRLDATNVCNPLVSVITSISRDHTRQLGDSLASIAREKAGIVKPGVPVVSGAVQPEPRDVIRTICCEQSADLIELGRDFTFRYIPSGDNKPRGLDYDGVDCRYRNLRLGLVGSHQAANAAVALAIVERLRRLGWRIPEEAVRRGLAETSCPGRVELLGREPMVVVDTAHNRASIEALAAAIDELHSGGRRFLIFATTQEKDIVGMLSAIRDRFDHVIFTRYQENPRGVPPEEMAEVWSEIGGADSEVCHTPAEAWQVAIDRAASDDLICVAGSFYLVAELRPKIIAFFQSADN